MHSTPEKDTYFNINMNLTAHEKVKAASRKGHGVCLPFLGPACAGVTDTHTSPPERLTWGLQIHSISYLLHSQPPLSLLSQLFR